MISIYLNDEQITIQSMVLSDILQEKNIKGMFAVAVNRQFVPRSLYETFFIKQDDKIDIILPMQGG